MPKIEAQTREAVAAFLPGAIAHALESYRRFSQEELQGARAEDEKDEAKSLTAKQFKDHHDACKVAIAHIELLIKLAKWASLPGEKDTPGIHHDQLAQMISNAQKEIDKRGV